MKLLIFAWNMRKYLVKNIIYRVNITVFRRFKRILSMNVKSPSTTLHLRFLKESIGLVINNADKFGLRIGGDLKPD